MKVILVIDMPEEYLKMIDSYDGNKIVDIGFNFDEQDGWTFARSMMSSIKPMPQKAINDERPTDKSIIDHSFCEGWNACIDEILGETDD